MATTSPLPPHLSPSPRSVSVDDFERLGIAGQEMRPDVIRHAVKNAAAPWVKKSLKGYNANTERELARVLSSGIARLNRDYALDYRAGWAEFKRPESSVG